MEVVKSMNNTNNYNDSNVMGVTSQHHTPHKYDKQQGLYFQRPKYFNSLIYFHNQVTGKNIECIIENLIVAYGSNLCSRDFDAYAQRHGETGGEK